MWLFLTLTSSLCFFVMTSSLVVWFWREYKNAVVRGHDVDQALRYSRSPDFDQFPSLMDAGISRQLFKIALSRWGTPLLFFVRNLEIKNRFGIRKRLKTTEKQLIQGSLRRYLTPQHFMTFTIVSALFGGVLTILPGLAFFGLAGGLLGLLVGAIMGYLIASALLTRNVGRRLLLIEKRLPFAIEFILLAMEASTSFPMAIEVYCDQMKEDPLAFELRVVLEDIDKGLTLVEALDNLDHRLNIELLSSFILTIKTGIETGQPIREVLKTQADLTRLKRYQDAEEIAKRASTEAIYPLMVILLAILILLIGPLILTSTRMSFY